MIDELIARLQLLGWSLVLTVLAAASLVLFVLSVVSAVLVIIWIGLPMVTSLTVATRQVAGLHRQWAQWRLGRPVPEVYAPLRGHRLLSQPVVLARDPATWRDLLWLGLNGTVGLALTIGAIVETVLGLIFWWLPRSVLLSLHAHLAAGFLVPSESSRLAQRVRELTASRARTVDVQAGELRRIERDLHDGAQARLVAAGMSLGLAEQQLDQDPEQARQLLAEAREANTQALAELRTLVRGVHPPVLADRGLLGAIQALALTLPLPVEVDGEPPGRLPDPIESAVYFAVAEALSNVIKHSGASQARVRLAAGAGVVRAEVLDDGRGGAVLAPGGGLHGIERRLSAFDGRVEVSSPVGGPTLVSLEVPCASS